MSRLIFGFILCTALSLGSEGQTIKGVLMDASCEAIARTAVEMPVGAPSPDTIRNNSASAAGTTGTADTTGATAGRAKIPTVAPLAQSRAEDERNRIGDTTSGALTVAEAANADCKCEKDVTTVGERYARCKPTARTTSFAIHAEGKLHVLDQEGNDMVRQQMGNEAFRAAMAKARQGSGFMTVTVVGTPGEGDAPLKITSIRK